MSNMLDRFLGSSTDFNTAPTVYGDPAAIGQPSADFKGEFDVLIMGGGLCGLAAARDLAKAGKTVLVVEKDRIGAGPSGRSGGQMWPGFEGTLGEMIEEFGDKNATAAWQIVHDGVRHIHQEILAHHPTRCDFQPGVLLVSKNRGDAEWIKDEAEVFKKAGFNWATYVDKAGLKKRLGSDVYRNALLYKGEEGEQYGHINPLLYVQQLAKLAKEAGALIAEESPVTAIRPRDGGGYVVTTPQGEVQTGQVVLATGSGFVRPEGLGLGVVPRFHMPVQTVILATEPMTRELAAKVVPGFDCFADAADSAMTYGRMVPANDGTDRLIFLFGGADAVSQVHAQLEAKKLEKELYQTYPVLQAAGIKVGTRWGGDCDLTRSALPVLKEVANDMFFVGGFSGQGMVNAVVYGRAVAEQITTGASEAFNALSALSPKPYAANELTAKKQLAEKGLGLMWGDAKSFFGIGSKGKSAKSPQCANS
jgi:gamma-glutamylputrescine oxidase